MPPETMNSDAGSDDDLSLTGLPHIRIGLIQSESESLNTPGHDLAPILAARTSWTVEVFTERIVEAALSAAASFDCLVIGIQAATQSGVILSALEEQTLDTNLVVLHQHRSSALDFLKSPLGVEAVELTSELRGLDMHGRSAIAPLRFRGDSPADEPLLNWPYPVLGDILVDDPIGSPLPVALFACPDPASDWKSVLELSGMSMPHGALLRADTDRGRAVLCLLDLEPDREHDLRLIVNAITYAGMGTPENVVVQTGSGRSARLTMDKMRLFGLRGVLLKTDRPSAGCFSEWPVSHARQLLLTGSDTSASRLVVTPEAQRWRAQGGSIVLIGDDDEITVRHGLSDPAAVASGWASWFHSVPMGSWHSLESGSIFLSRAIARFLVRLEADDRAAMTELGLQAASAYRESLEVFLRGRIGNNYSFDDTVSTTAAALEIHRLVGGDVLPADLVNGVEAWLRDVFDERGPEERLEIARVLEDPQLFRRVCADLPRQLRVNTAVRLMLAAGEVGVAPPDSLELHETPELEVSLPLASEFLEAASVLTLRFPDHPLVQQADRSSVPVAAATLDRFSELRVLLQGASKKANGILICGESLGRFAFLGRERTTIHALASSSTAATYATSGALLREIRSTREEMAALRAQGTQDVLDLQRVRHLIGAVLLALALAVGLGVFRIAGLSWASLLIAVPVATAVLVFVSLAMGRWVPSWIESLLDLLEDGVTGFVSALRRRSKDASGD